MLIDLFPAPGEATSRAALVRWGLVFLQVVVVGVGAVAMLARLGGRPAWESVWAEDPGIYLPAALAHPWHLLQSYGGYLQLVPRVIGQIAALLPVRHASVAFAVGGALVASGVGVFVYYASDGIVSSRWLRVMLGLSVVLLPVAQLEIADNGVNTIWYLLVGLFWAALWRPRTRAGAAVAAVLAFAAAASTSLGLVFAPLFAARAIVVPRRLREHVVTAGWALGCLVQLLVIVTSHTSRLTPHNPLNAVAYYTREVLLPTIGLAPVLAPARPHRGERRRRARRRPDPHRPRRRGCHAARADPGVRGYRGADRPGVHSDHVCLGLGRPGPAGADQGGARRPVLHAADPAARRGADRGGRRLRAPLVAAPQGHRRGRRAGSGPGGRLGHRLPLPGAPTRRPASAWKTTANAWLRHCDRHPAGTITVSFKDWWGGKTPLTNTFSCTSLHR